MAEEPEGDHKRTCVVIYLKRQMGSIRFTANTSPTGNAYEAYSEEYKS